MPKFRKKPVVVDAMRLAGTPAEFHAVYQWVEQNTLGSFEPLEVIDGEVPIPESGVTIDPRSGRMVIATLEGLHWANPGDWIVQGTAGEFYPVKPEIFDATYEPAEPTMTDSRCPSCGGCGLDIEGPSYECTRCGGAGGKAWDECPVCWGGGSVGSLCAACNGSGVQSDA